jgi:hypothetical protein
MRLTLAMTADDHATDLRHRCRNTWTALLQGFVGTRPAGVIVGDFSWDSKLDLAVTAEE